MFFFRVVGFSDENNDEPRFNELWEMYGKDDGYEKFNFSWVEIWNGSYKGFYRSAVWINRYLNIVIIFLQNEVLLKDILRSISYKFKLKLSILNFKERNLNVNSVKFLEITPNGLISTELLDTDESRIKLINQLYFIISRD